MVVFRLLASVNLGVRFILELVILYVLSHWGFNLDQKLLAMILGIVLPLITAMTLGMLVSPKASIKLPLALKLLVEALIFGVAVMCFIDLGFTMLAVVFATIAIVNRCLIIVWKQ